MSKKLIEVACFGNQGRSPIAELALKNLVANGINGQYQDLADEYEVISSGVGVDDIKKGNIPTNAQVRYVKQALDRGDVYTAKGEAEHVKDAIEKGDVKVIDSFYNKAVERFGAEEKKFRKEVLPHLGLEGKLKEIQEQTTPNKKVVVFFAMDQRGLDAARKKYADAGIPEPQIMAVLGPYVGSPEVTNTFGNSKAVYKQGASQIMKDAEFALDRVVNETYKKAV